MYILFIINKNLPVVNFGRIEKLIILLLIYFFKYHKDSNYGA